jgi:hypothetical protein
VSTYTRLLRAVRISRNFPNWSLVAIREAISPQTTCSICGRRRMTLLLDTSSGRLSCFQCLGLDGAPPAHIREPGDYVLSEPDQRLLKEMGISFGNHERIHGFFAEVIRLMDEGKMPSLDELIRAVAEMRAKYASKLRAARRAANE